MKKKLIIGLGVLSLIVVVLCFGGIGAFSSSSAVQDLRAELETIYGKEYTGKTIENGVEDMEFVIVPKSWFFTNWGLRDVLSIDYKYECRVIFTINANDSTKSVRTIIYQAIDPMGKGKITERAYLNLDSKIEKIENE